MIDKEKKVLKNRAYLIFFGFVAVMATIIYTVISIQFTELEPGLMPGDRKIPERIVLDKPTPGDVLDKDLNPLVTTVSYYDVYMDPVVVSEALFESKIDSLAAGISDLFHEKSATEITEELKHARKNGNRYVQIQKQVTNEQRKSLRALPIFEEGTFKGGIIDGKETSVRKNPKGQLAKRTLGYYRKDGEKVVAVGIEGAYQNYLAGVSGQQIQQKLANGWRNTGVIVQESVAGSDIVTTIDSDIQEVAHSELEKQLITMDAPEGCVIVMEVATGYIRAISNLRRNSDSSYSESFNYAIGRNSLPDQLLSSRH
jgi:cell division protein FtsI (penicillin-binding protein 3)